MQPLKPRRSTQAKTLPSKPRTPCPHCGATGIYHWGWCNAPDEYIAWMEHHTIADPMPAKGYKD
jgi:hypothetical protein